MFKLFLTEFNSDSEPNDKLNPEANPQELEQQKSLELQLTKADNLWKQGKISEAISLYCQAIELQPNSTEVYGQLNAILKQQEELALAYKRLAVQLKQQGQAKEAAICYRQAIILQAINYSTEEKYLKNQNSELVVKPNLPTATLADSAFSFLPLSSSSPHKRILQISLDDSYQGNWLNLQAKNQTQSHQAISVAEETAKLYLQQALEYGERQEWEQVAIACQKAIEIVPNLAEAYKLWGNALQRMGQTAAAMDCYAKAVEIQPDLAEVYARIGSLYAQQKQWQQAIDYYQKAIIIRPNFAQAYRSLAKIWYLVGELEKANFCRKQALNLESLQIHPASSQEQSVSGDRSPQPGTPELPEATDELKSIAEYQKLAQSLEKQNKWQEAAIYYRKALEITTGKLSSSLTLPKTKSKHQFPRLDRLQQLRENNSGEETSLTTKVELLAGNIPHLKAGEVSPEDLLSTTIADAESTIDKDRPIAPSKKSQQSQLNRAIQRYLKQAELKPDSAKIQTDLGNLYAKKRQWKAAIAAYHKAIKINQQYALAYLNLAKVLAKVGKNRESVGYMYRALTLKPELFSAKDYFYLGKSFIEQDKLRKGIGYCLKAIKLDPNYLEVYYYLGTVMSQQGQQQKALNYLLRAIKRNPQEAQSYYLLGQELASQNKWDEAVKAYSQVLAIQPRFPYASEKLNHALAEKLKQDLKPKQN